MRRVIFSLALLLAGVLAMPAKAWATEVGTVRPFGLGLQLFEPTAVVGKLFLDPHNALDFGVGFWGYGRCYNADGPYYCDRTNQFFSLHFDYLHEQMIVQSSAVKLDWHVGGGGRMVFHSYVDSNGTRDVALFARVPIGLDLTFRVPSWLEAYLEVGPGLWVFPPLAFDIDIGLGARAYF